MRFFALAATWTVLAALTAYTALTKQWDVAIPLAVVQMAPAIYAGQEYDRIKDWHQ